MFDIKHQDSVEDSISLKFGKLIIISSILSCFPILMGFVTAFSFCPLFQFHHISFQAFMMAVSILGILLAAPLIVAASDRKHPYRWMFYCSVLSSILAHCILLIYKGAISSNVSVIPQTISVWLTLIIGNFIFRKVQYSKKAALLLILLFLIEIALSAVYLQYYPDIFLNCRKE